MKISAGVLVAVAVVGGGVLVAQKSVSAPGAASVASSKGLLGSENFRPSPEHPVGWRGDWTGCYPGANAPLTWSRRVKGSTTELYYQAAKPKGEPGKDARQLEYFTIKDWLIAGPFSAQDPVKDLDKDFLGGETAAEPDDGGKAGDMKWKYVRVGMENQARHECNEGTVGHLNIDYTYLFGKITADKNLTIEGDFNNKIAYAHTYVHAPAEGKFRLRIPIAASAGRYWLNGKSGDLDPRNQDRVVDVTLVKGWNRLLIKTGVANGLGKHYSGYWQSAWRVAAYLEPLPPVTYETKNIAWMTRVTGYSMSQPIIIGDRLYVGANISDLLCIDKKDGKIQWIRSNTPYETMTAEERSASDIKDKIAPLVEKLEQLNQTAMTAINAAVSPQGTTPEQPESVNRVLKEKYEAEKAIHNAFAAIDRKKYPPMYENEVSAANATPVSDGKLIYWSCGGGMKGPGNNVISCTDLAGKRIWSSLQNLGSTEHGNHTSPALVDGKVIYAAKSTVIALDAATGALKWSFTTKDWENWFESNAPLVVRVGKDALIVMHRRMHKVSDGTELCVNAPGYRTTSGTWTPVMNNGIVYFPWAWTGGEDKEDFLAVKPPSSVADGAQSEIAWKLDSKDVSIHLRGSLADIASPLYAEGVVYRIDMSGGLVAVDTSAKKVVYRQWLDSYNRYNRYLYGFCASPTLGGKYVYIIDGAGYTHVFKTGPDVKELSRNILENIVGTWSGNPCKQECFYTAPVFEGNRMYLRAQEYLYCIAEKTK